ncbi:phage tail tube protein [Ihubacter massiliensis]|uniref:phage tail tube protein n=1 Tax=Ihubacter massiliensis TaxID=1852367 RepID=UPI0020970151|nr:phage tail tube protein [Ihubacter massiliensis]MCI7301322.1 phage tail tube protein [Clostridia bacterium]MCO7120594.1 phage tail tube protein [Ihubacter massiliensis]MDY3010598.1 phage tail tube protein [Clostridiales Family XIII bacterium]
MDSYTPEKVINGTYGEVWFDDQYMAETTACKGEIDIDNQEVTQTGTRGTGYKFMGYKGTGELKMNKVSSFTIKKITEQLKQGKTPTATIISKLDDPDAYGSERVKFVGCTFNKLTITDWEAKKLTEETIPFNFQDYELIDTI